MTLCPRVSYKFVFSARRALPLLLTGLLLPSCNQTSSPALKDQRVQDTRSFNAVTPTFTALSGATIYQGQYSGLMGKAAYAIEVPANWNGQLVMYTHGYAGTGADLKVQEPLLRKTWITQGYAWAASSYSSNYYDVRAGIEDTNALAGQFSALTGLPQPTQNLIMGVSMGGHIAGAAIEAETLKTAQHKVTYAAAMPVCGVMNQDFEFKWLGDYTLVAAQLAGYGPQSYPQSNYQSVLPNIESALFSSTTGPIWQENSGAGAKLREYVRGVTGGDRPVFDLGFRQGTYQKAVFSTGGSDGTVTGILARNTYDNQNTVYRWTTDAAPSAEEQAFNAAILRVRNDPYANAPRRSGLRWLPRINGEISVPVLTMHTTGDLYVPFRHQQLYNQAVQAKGHSNLLVQRAIRAAGHCEFTTAELSEGFNDLVNWQKTGVKPAGDDVITPAVIADPNYGCNYTRQTRTGVASCPAPAAQLPH